MPKLADKKRGRKGKVPRAEDLHTFGLKLQEALAVLSRSLAAQVSAPPAVAE